MCKVLACANRVCTRYHPRNEGKCLGIKEEQRKRGKSREKKGKHFVEGDYSWKWILEYCWNFLHLAFYDGCIIV